mgnify:CR=1 FL=1
MTENEIIDELHKLLSAKHQEPDDAFTVTEWCEMLGLQEKAVRKRFRVVKKAGRLDRVIVMRENLAGAVVPIPAYRIIPG